MGFKSTFFTIALLFSAGMVASVHAQAATRNGPTVSCPTCQPNSVTPATAISLEYQGNTGNPEMSIISDKNLFNFYSQLPLTPVTTATPRMVWENTKDEAKSKWAMTLTEMFVIDQSPAAEPTFVSGIIPSKDRLHEVSFTSGNPVEYKWTNTQGNIQSTTPVSSATLLIKGERNPEDAGDGQLDPKIEFGVTYLANVERTLARVKFSLTDFNTAFWKKDDTDLTNPRFAMVFRLNRMTQSGTLASPREASLKDAVDATAADLKVLQEKIGEVDGKEITLTDPHYKVVAGGINLLIAKTAKDGSGNNVPVRVKLGKDRSGAHAVYVIFDKFDTSIDLTTYSGLNAYAVYSWATWTAPAFATILVCILAALYLQ